MNIAKHQTGKDLKVTKFKTFIIPPVFKNN